MRWKTVKSFVVVIRVLFGLVIPLVVALLITHTRVSANTTKEFSPRIDTPALSLNYPNNPQPAAPAAASIFLHEYPDPIFAMYGGNAQITVVLSNTGDVQLNQVIVSAPDAPNCARDVGSIAPHDAKNYVCTAYNVTHDFDNHMSVTANSSAGPTSDSDYSTILVVMPVYGPSIRISQDPARTMVNPNDADASHREAKFYIAVINDGNVALTNIQVTDQIVPDCARSFTSLVLAPGAVVYYTCYKSVNTIPLNTSFTSTVTVTASPVGGGTVSDSDADRIVVANYVLEAGYNVNATTIRRNQELTYTISLENITVGVTATNVIFNASIPRGTTFKRVIGGTYSSNLSRFNGPGVYWQGPVPGASAPGNYTYKNMTFVVQVNAVGGSVNSVGIVTTSGQVIVNDTMTTNIIPAHAVYLPIVKR